MPKNTRYDKLARKIRREFERAMTFTNAQIGANGREILVDALQESWRTDNEKFGNFRPYNSLSVDNQSSQTIRVYLSESRTWYFDVQPESTRSLAEGHYFTYVEIQELDGTQIAADDVHVSVGKFIDAREMDLLEMSGMLDV